MMGVRLERNKSCPALGFFASFFKSSNFGMNYAVIVISSFPDDFAARGNDRASDKRIWTDQTDPLARQIESSSRKLNISFPTLTYRIRMNRRAHSNQLKSPLT